MEQAGNSDFYSYCMYMELHLDQTILPALELIPAGETNQPTKNQHISISISKLSDMKFPLKGSFIAVRRSRFLTSAICIV